ncbi:TfpX/TfpZ family type IV pilin accessory protein [Acinetobacter sp.]|uniref:TfpX/TfpZ family type IV pilin accessory protein n=1 Tax=Acinetobacter sp. TaxID=472 RepID=UPI002FC6B6D8
MSKRLNFFLVHLLCSIVIAFLLLIWVFNVWYPYPLAKALGVIDIIILLLIVDIIIGPMLCFIVYKTEKKTLKFDLMVVIFFQILAFSVGVYNLSEGRPVWIVYNQGNMDLVQRVEIITDDMKYALPVFQTIPMFGPEIAAVKTLGFNNESAEKAKSISFIQQPEKYILINKEAMNIKKNIHKISELYKTNEKQKVDNLLLKHADVQGWLPLRATTKNMVVLLNIDNLKIISIVDLRY